MFTQRSSTAALTQLTRLAQRRPQTLSLLENALAGRVRELTADALDVAVETGDPIGQLLGRAAYHGSVEEALLLADKLDDERYRDSIPLREAALLATSKGLDALSAVLESEPELFAARAAFVQNLGMHFIDLNLYQEALEVTRDAVNLHRRLARRQPDVYERDLAGCLLNLGAVCNELGSSGGEQARSHLKEGVKATREAVKLYRRLVKRDTGRCALRASLADGLVNLSTDLHALGRRKGSLKAAREGIGIYRGMTDDEALEFLPGIALAFDRLSIVLGSLGRAEQALEAIREALTVTGRSPPTGPTSTWPAT